MRPRKDDEALVDVLDVILRDGVVVRADVIVSVAEVPLVGIKLSAAIAGMETMNEYGLFEEWDARRRSAAVSRRQYRDRRPAERTEEVDDSGPDGGSESATAAAIPSDDDRRVVSRPIGIGDDDEGDGDEGDGDDGTDGNDGTDGDGGAGEDDATS